MEKPGTEARFEELLQAFLKSKGIHLSIEIINNIVNAFKDVIPMWIVEAYVAGRRASIRRFMSANVEYVDTKRVIDWTATPPQGKVDENGDPVYYDPFYAASVRISGSLHRSIDALVDALPVEDPNEEDPTEGEGEQLKTQ